MPELARWGVRALRVAVPLALMTAIAAIAHLPVGEPAPGSALRLALRTAAARVEVCRDRTEAELAALPAHMRQVRICTETAVDYRLTVAIDGARRLDRRIEHRGVRRTRPLTVDAELPVAAGRHRVALEFVPIDPPAEAAAKLPAPRFDAEVDFAVGRVVLLSLAPSGELGIVGGGVGGAALSGAPGSGASRAAR
ncbi:MAG: hypothetical protein AMXMBFR36_13870 [Acidobacteriota bacterium]